jgi:hypothetical protein
MFGEAYVPYAQRDYYYQFVQPHNFLLYSVVRIGIVGTLLLGLLVWYVLIWAGGAHSGVTGALAALLVTQLTDAGFTNYPISAYVSLLLALCYFDVRARLAGARWAMPPGQVFFRSN